MLLKAIRGLPEHEQTTLLQSLIERALASVGGATGPPSFPQPLGEAMRSMVAQAFEGQGLAGLVEQKAPLGKMCAIPVRFPEQQYKRLKEWCEANGFPMAVVVRGVVERFLDQQQASRPPAG